MSRFPNPWIAVPTTIAAAGGAFVGFFVTNASCGAGGCQVLAGVVAGLAGLTTAFGVGVVVVLAARSLREWEEHADRDVVTPIEPDRDSPPTC